MEQKGNILIPVSIIIAGAIVAGAVYFSGAGGTGSVANVAGPDGTNGGAENAPVGAEAEPELREVNDADHIRGSVDAPVKIVEFSDLECPFCKSFHETMKQVQEEYSGDEVAWVYRHLPLTSIHPQAEPAAYAAECVAELKGNNAFWGFVDGVFADQQNIGEDLYANLAAEYGIEAGALTDCMEREDIVQRVAEDTQDALKAGARGTPHSMVVTPAGELVPIPGALPFSSVKTLIDQLFEEEA